MNYNSTSVASKGMSLNEVRGIIERIEIDHGLVDTSVEEREIGDQVKFVTFSGKIDGEERAKRIIDLMKTDYGLGYVDRKYIRKKSQVEAVNFSVSIKIDNEGNGRG